MAWQMTYASRTPNAKAANTAPTSNIDEFMRQRLLGLHRLLYGMRAVRIKFDSRAKVILDFSVETSTRNLSRVIT
jgi:hypothetical protein